MKITEKDVLHVARLARLELTAEEIPRMAHDLGRILDYVDALSKVDTTGVAETSYVAVEAAPLRTDEVAPSLDNAQVMAEAPRHVEGGFAVVGFVDEA